MTSYSTTHPLPHDFPHLELTTLCDKGDDPTLRHHDHQTLGASIWHATFLLRRIKAMKAAIYLTFKYSDDQLGLGGRESLVQHLLLYVYERIFKSKKVRTSVRPIKLHASCMSPWLPILLRNTVICRTPLLGDID